MKPRDYQDAAIDAVVRYFMEKTGNPIIALPTGTGKSLVQALLVKKFIEWFPSTRILCLTHVKELIENNHETLLRIWPTAPAGIYSSGLKRKDLHAQVTFGGIASIDKRVSLFKNTDIIMIDECHLVNDKGTTRYAKFINALRAMNPKLKVIGLSATPWRLGLGHLTDGELFDEVCFDLTSGDAFLWMIDQGYLAPVVPKKTKNEIDTTKVKVRGGEFLASDLNDTIDAQNIIEYALEEALESAGDRNHWLIFASSIDHCEQIASELNSMGIPAASVHSKMPSGQRDDNIADFKNGDIRALVNKNILTTGFDSPHIDCIIMLRPTKSPGLWVQMLGRGTRPVFAPGFDISTKEGRLAAMAQSEKQNCLVLDFAGNTRELGPINYPKMPKKKGEGSGEPPTRVCPECDTYVHISHKTCPECGYLFPPPKPFTPKADTSELISRKNPNNPVFEIFAVGDMLGSLHKKVGKPDSVKVSYYTNGRRVFHNYVGVEHKGYFHTKSKDWWLRHCPTKNQPIPETTRQLLEKFPSLRVPTHIRVRVDTKYPEVVDYDFTGTGFDPSNLTLPGTPPAAPSVDSGYDREGSSLSQLLDLQDFQ